MHCLYVSTNYTMDTRSNFQRGPILDLVRIRQDTVGSSFQQLFQLQSNPGDWALVSANVLMTEANDRSGSASRQR
jgi:hypothetical protein